MLSGYYAIASGMMSQQRNLDVIGNNLINVETPGYRAERMVFTTFQHELMIRREAGARVGIGVASPITLVSDVVTLHNSGVFEDTGFAFDLAIDGPGYFQIQGNGDQMYLTRSGQFNMDEEGYLILPGVGRVMGSNGPVQVKNAQFKVAPNGAVTNDAGRRVDTLMVVAPELTDDLDRLGNGMYRLGTDKAPGASDGYVVAQGVKERSNVDYNLEMTTFIEAQRAFQSCATALQMIDTLNRKSVSQIAAI